MEYSKIHIDTIRIKLENYHIKPEANIIIQPATHNVKHQKSTEHYLFSVIDNSGNPICYRGNKAYLNTENLNLSIISNYNKFEKSFDSAFYLQISVPKLLSSNNLNIDYKHQEGLKTALQVATDELYKAGVETDLNRAKLIRIDIYRNILSDYNFFAFKRIFESVKPKNYKTDYTRDYGTTLRIGNKTENLCFYDKLLQVKEKQKIRMSALEEELKQLEIDKAKNITRAELRNMTTRNIRKKFSVETVQALLDSQDLLDKHYRDYIAGMKIKDNKHNFVIIKDDIINEILQATGKKQIDYFMYYVISEIINNPDLTKHQALLEAYLEATGKSYRMKKIIRNSIYEIIRICNKQQVNDFYNEVLQGLAQ